MIIERANCLGTVPEVEREFELVKKRSERGGFGFSLERTHRDDESSTERKD
jgi:hypothetical protein